MSDAVTAAMTQAFEPYCLAYCQDHARLEVNVQPQYIIAHLFLSARDRVVITQGPLQTHLDECFETLGTQLGEGRQLLGMDYVVGP